MLEAIGWCGYAPVKSRSGVLHANAAISTFYWSSVLYLLCVRACACNGGKY